MTKCLKPYSCKLKKQQCSRRSATCWAQRVDTKVDWPNSFWDMTKCLKPYSCKLKKQQCSRRSATCWAQRVDTKVDWPNSFWDMTKCLKPYSCKLKKQQCSRRSATCSAQRVDIQVDWPNSFWDVKVAIKPNLTLGYIFAKPKDPVETNQKTHAIYSIPCSDCTAKNAWVNLTHTLSKINFYSTIWVDITHISC